jgi:hypothetical protein
MKLITILCLSLLIFAGCHKDENVTPANNTKSSTSGGSGKTPTGGGSTTVTDTVPALSHDDSIHMARFDAKGTKLTMVFNENVDILITEEGYQKTSAVHLLENFTKTTLYGFDYTTVAAAGNTTFDWVDDNLNNVIDKTISDTVINNQKMVKINVHRPFTFSKNYTSAQQAQSEEAVFAAKTTDTVGFSSYLYYAQKNYRPTSASAVVVYSK